MRIRTVKPELTLEEAAEFRGLFFGEGHIDLCKDGRSQSFNVRLRIAVRDDDREIVEWVRDRFGGWLVSEARTRSVCWAITGRHLVGAALDVLDAGTLPSKKRREVALAKQALAILPGKRLPHGEMDLVRAQLIAIRDELKAVRAYRTEVA